MAALAAAYVGTCIRNVLNYEILRLQCARWASLVSHALWLCSVLLLKHRSPNNDCKRRLGGFVGFAFATVTFTSKLRTLKLALLPSASTAGQQDNPAKGILGLYARYWAPQVFTSGWLYKTPYYHHVKTVPYVTNRARCTTWTVKFLSVQGEKPLHCFQKEEFRQAGQTAEKHHMIPWQVVKASKGFVSQDALASSGGTGSVTQEGRASTY